MNAAVATIDKQINECLGVLTIQQKKALLTVTMTFATEPANEYRDEFKAELDSHYDEYKNGGKLISEAAVYRRIHKIIKGKTK